ncbi:Uncharacterised protein [Mycobacteroides abscessus subsp. abscessus]|nr:Uncharacterised protein [Mycobacteroides abscessus subsp. abscessus]
MPICHSSRQVVPSQPDPSSIPSASRKTLTLIALVRIPAIKHSPVTPSTTVKTTIDHFKGRGARAERR